MTVVDLFGAHIDSEHYIYAKQMGKKIPMIIL